MAEEIIMTGRTLAQACVDVANTRKTIYAYAMYGFQITDKTIASKAKQNLNGWYTAKRIRKLQAVANQTPPTWGFDCVNLIKAILWGWWGNPEKEKGGAVYASNGIPDTNADGMIARCSDVTTDFSSIEVGEAVWQKGHIGVYIGNGLAVECTPRWSDGVQITAVHNIGKIAGYNGRSWTKHGKLPHVNYGNGTAVDVEMPDYELGHRLLKRGCEGEDVRELQNALIKLGYNCGPDGGDGDFGSMTEAAVMAFQTANGLEVDGKFGEATLTKLKEALAKADEVPLPELKFTVTIRNVNEDQLEAIKEQWPECEFQPE